MIRPHTRIAWAVFAMIAALIGNVSRGDEPLYKQDPFDQVTVEEKGEDVIIKIETLTGLGNPRVIPVQRPGNAKLRVRLLDDEDDQDFDISWKDIKKIELFEQLVLGEARKLTDAKKFDDAWEVLKFLQDRYATLPELDAGINRYLYFAGVDALRRSNSVEATSIFEELASRDIQFRPTKDDEVVATLLGVSADPIIEKYINKQDYASAQFVLNRLARKFALQQTNFYKNWEEKLDKLAVVERDAAAQAVEDKRYTDAYDAAAKMMRIWPAVKGGRELAAKISSIYPMVIVGVTMPTSKADPLAIDNWSARRAGRLTKRLMMDFEKITPEGGQYRFAFGKYSTSDDGVQFILSPSGDERREIALSLADRLLGMADKGEPSFSIPWARAMRSVSVSKAGDVLVDLNYAHVNPAALIQSSVDAGAGVVADLRSPYLIRTQDDGKATRFIYDPDVPLASPSQPKEILERLYPDPPAALLALKRGDIDVIDRIAPVDLTEARSIKEIVVDRYATPFLHVLIPNMDRTLPASRTLRRALVHGISRDAILQQGILKGAKIPGCQVVSGPFPAPITNNDPLAYAYDEEIAPHVFDPLLSITLLTIAKRELDSIAAAKAKNGESPPAEATAPTNQAEAPPQKTEPTEEESEEEEDDENKAVNPSGIQAFVATIILAHPAEDMARTTCRAIAQQWKVLGIDVQLKELPEGESTDPSGEYDFLFAELQIWEPVVQASQIVGTHGLGRTINPHIALALRRVEASKNWAEVSAQLKALHRLVHDDCTLMPLWQVVHHMAYRKGLQGIRKQPAAVYDNMLQWKVTPRTLGDR
jgi:peptide/nickel transport system substrate-binding protein